MLSDAEENGGIALQVYLFLAVTMGPPFFIGDELAENLFDAQYLGMAEHVVRQGLDK